MGGSCIFGLAGILAVVVLTAPTFSAQAQVAPRSEIPIHDVVLSDGEHRFTIPIIVGGVQIEAGLDSGSTGLRILPGVVPASAEQHIGHRETYGYDSGTEFEGPIVEADTTIGIGGRSRFQQIDIVRCHNGARSCPAARVKPAEFGIQGSGLPGEGFKAIIGINMAADSAPNPLVALGARRWIIELPRPGDDKPGRLVLNPADAEVAEYKTMHIDAQFSDQRGGLHDAVQGCLVNQSNKRSYCGPADLDTGAPGVQVATPGPTNPWEAQAPATMVFYEKGQPIIGAEFKVEGDPGARVTIRSEPRSRLTRLYFGILPYYAFSVLYDPQAKAIGLKPR